METHVTRQMGATYHPDRFCPYSGRKLWGFPDPASGLYVWYREPDAYVFKCRLLTPEETAWIAANPQAFAERRQKFKAWLVACRNATS